jgi:hypothetical protein
MAVSIAWSIFRSLVIRRVFGSHGTSAVTYFAIDLGTTIPYAHYSAKAAFALLDRDSNFSKFAAIATVCFLAPDIYVVITARQVSNDVWIGFGAFVTCMAVLAIVKARRDGATHQLNIKK